MAHKGVWLARCMHMEGGECSCPNNSRKQQKWQQPHAALAATDAVKKKTAEFTLQQLKDQISPPLVTIDTTVSLHRYKLRDIYNKIVQKARREATEFVQGKTPILPQDNSLACIALSGKVQDDTQTVEICFEMKSLYIKGVLVREKFYELRTSGNVATWLVDESIALECGDTYFEMLGRRHNPPVELSDSNLVQAFKTFVRLTPGATRDLLQAAARCIGMTSLILIEPSRQHDVMENMCRGVQRSAWYLKMELCCWTSVHSWDTRSKAAKGIDYEDGEIVEKRYEPEERSNAIKLLRVVNSTKKLPVKKISRSPVPD